MVKNNTEQIAEINQLISKRTNYGMREEKVGKNSKVISWSNTSKRWIYWGEPNRVRFDANEVVIPDIPEEQLLRILKELEVLPLDKFGFEAFFTKD